jgi:molecular chaperone DnaK
MSKAIGIDLGTTYSCVAVVENGQAKVIPNKGGYRTTPSVVAFEEGGRRLVGHLAKRQMLTNPQNTISASKRLIGRKFDSKEIKKATASYPYEIIEGPHGDVRIRAGGQELSLPEVGAIILQEMRRVAEEYLGDKVTEAVITVPAYFNDGQRQATKDAGKIAGMDVLRIINEPTAAALAYGYGKKLEQTIAVYDLGGGTFDISILEINEGVFEVISTAGDTYLGGDDFDDRIIDYLAESFQSMEGVNLRRDSMALQRLKDAAEKAKIELSSSLQAQVNLPFIAAGDKGPLHLDIVLTRQKLEDLTEDLVGRTISICQKTLEAAGLGRQDIDEVILVGGQTRMPAVQKKVEEFLGKAPRKGVHPDEVVAMGAAIQGEALISAAEPEKAGERERKGEDLLLLDVTPLSLGIATFGGFFTPVIEKNTTIPTHAGHVFTTAADNQKTVKIIVLQGESDRAADNELLGEFMLAGIRPARRGEPEIEVTFDIDSDGIVSVAAKDLDTGQEQSITVTASSGLSEQEIQWMVDASRDYEVELKKRGDIEKACNNLESLLLKVEKAASTHTGKLPRDVAGDAKRLVERGRRAIEFGDMEQIEKYTQDAPKLLEKIEGMAK